MDQEQKNKSMPDAWQHDKVLGDCMIKLYENNLWTDVKFRCKNHDEHERIHAHKIVLAARSPVFQAMFFGPCAEATGEIMLDKTEVETFDLFLRFIYQDKVTLTEDIAASVLETAHYYQVTNLVLYCVDFLATCITSQNVCDLLSLARCYDVVSLCKECCVFIDENADEIMESEGYLKVSLDTLTYIMKGDTFYADEVSIFKKAEEWAQKNIEESNLDKHGQNVRNVLGSSFFHLRLPTMTSENLLKCTRRKGYLSTEEYEDLVDFINKTPDTTVTSNSCISRLPTEERIDFTDEVDEVITDTIMTTFQVSVSRDVKVKTVELADIYPYLKYEKELYTSVSKPVSCYNKSAVVLFHDYDEKVIMLKDFRSSHGGYAAEIDILKKNPDYDLQHNVDIIISGVLKVTCCKEKAEMTADDDVNNSTHYHDDESGFDIEEEEKEYLVIEQEIEVISTNKIQRIINLEKPLILEESRSPYTFTLNLKYKNVRVNEIKMKTFKSSEVTFTNSHGSIKVENIIGNFSGIKCICFGNRSNRE